MPQVVIPRIVMQALDPDVSDWRAAIFGAGSSVSLSTLLAADTFVRGMKSASLWNKMHMVHLCCGANLTAALVRIKVPTGVARAMTNTNFLSGNYSESTGLVGNASTKRLDTLISPDAGNQNFDATSLMVWQYSRTTTSPGNWGSTGAGNNTLTWGDNGTLGNWDRVGIATMGSAEYAPASPGQGFFTGLHGGGTNGSRAMQYYANGTAKGSTATATGSTSAWFGPLALYAVYRGGSTWQSFSGRTVTSVFISQGLNSTEVATFNTLVQAFETALGRNV